MMISDESMTSTAVRRINDATAEALATITKQLRKAGAVHIGISYRSALVQRDWRLPDGHELSIDGWHGLGKPGAPRYYGSMRTILRIVHHAGNHVSRALCDFNLFTNQPEPALVETYLNHVAAAKLAVEQLLQTIHYR